MACFKSFQDTFCRKTKQANWEKEIPLEKWSKFLAEKYNFPINDESSMALMSNFIQEKRMAFFIHPRYGIPLRDLREEFDLKSTFFNCHVKDNMVYLKGKGNGHGVGLCQEGAIIMASKGYDFKQILAYYYIDMYLDKIVKLRLNR
jgi:stage II sporulation protein D